MTVGWDIAPALADLIGEIYDVLGRLSALARRDAPWSGAFSSGIRAGVLRASLALEGQPIPAAVAHALAADPLGGPASTDPRWRGVALAWDRASAAIGTFPRRWDLRLCQELSFLLQRGGPTTSAADQHSWRQLAALLDQLGGLDVAVPRPVRAVAAMTAVQRSLVDQPRSSVLAFLAFAAVLAEGTGLPTDWVAIDPWMIDHRADYLSARELAMSRSPSDMLTWAAFCLRACHQGLQLSYEQAQATSTQHDNCAHLRTLEQLSPRCIDALMRAATDHPLTNHGHRGRHGIAPATAVQDLRSLVAAGWLRTQGAGRSTSYRATDQLRRALSTAGRPGRA